MRPDEAGSSVIFRARNHALASCMVRHGGYIDRELLVRSITHGDPLERTKPVHEDVSIPARTGVQLPPSPPKTPNPQCAYTTADESHKSFSGRSTAPTNRSLFRRCA